MGMDKGRNVATAEVIDKERKALELRRAGFTLDVIAQEVGYANRSVANRAIRRALGRTLRQPADELRQLESERLDALHAAVWGRALRGDLNAVQQVLRISDARRQLLGLNHSDGLAERALAAEQERVMLQLLIGGGQQLVADLVAAGVPAGPAQAAAGKWLGAIRDRASQVLELEAGDVVDAEVVEDPPPRRRAPRKTTPPKETP